MDKRTDLEIISACLAGDGDAFEEIVNRYKNLVYSIILKQTRDQHEADDISQEVFLKVYLNLNKYSSEFKFSTWIMRITGNHIIDLRRKRKLETVSYEEYAESGERQTAFAPSPEDEYLRRERTARINKIVADLPDNYKIPVVLYHQEGLSYQEIADRIQEPLSKVKNRIFRGRKLLKAALAESGDI